MGSLKRRAALVTMLLALLALVSLLVVRRLGVGSGRLGGVEMAQDSSAVERRTDKVVRSALIERFQVRVGEREGETVAVGVRLKLRIVGSCNGRGGKAVLRKDRRRVRALGGGKMSWRRGVGALGGTRMGRANVGSAGGAPQTVARGAASALGGVVVEASIDDGGGRGRGEVVRR